MKIYAKADRNARKKIYSYHVYVSDVLWAILDQKNTQLSTSNTTDITQTGYMTVIPLITATVPEIDVISIIEKLRQAGMIRMTEPGSSARVKVSAEKIAACESKEELKSYCIEKQSMIYAQRLIEIFTDTDNFNKKPHNVQEELTNRFIERMNSYGVKDIKKIIIEHGVYRPTDQQMLKEYLAVSGGQPEDTVINAADINFVRKKLKASNDQDTIQAIYDRKLNPDERSVIAKSGITAEEVEELMKENHRSTLLVAEELSKRTDTPVQYQQVGSYCRRHNIKLGRYHAGAIFCDMEIIRLTKGWPDAKFLCRCINCGTEKECFQSTLHKYKKEGKNMCKICKKKRK